MKCTERLGVGAFGNEFSLVAFDAAKATSTTYTSLCVCKVEQSASQCGRKNKTNIDGIKYIYTYELV